MMLNSNRMADAMMKIEVAIMEEIVMELDNLMLWLISKLNDSMQLTVEQLLDSIIDILYSDASILQCHPALATFLVRHLYSLTNQYLSFPTEFLDQEQSNSKMDKIQENLNHGKDDQNKNQLQFFTSLSLQLKMFLSEQGRLGRIVSIYDNMHHVSLQVEDFIKESLLKVLISACCFDQIRGSQFNDISNVLDITKHIQIEAIRRTLVLKDLISSSRVKIAKSHSQLDKQMMFVQGLRLVVPSYLAYYKHHHDIFEKQIRSGLVTFLVYQQSPETKKMIENLLSKDYDMILEGMMSNYSEYLPQIKFFVENQGHQQIIQGLEYLQQRYTSDSTNTSNQVKRNNLQSYLITQNAKSMFQFLNPLKHILKHQIQNIPDNDFLQIVEKYNSFSKQENFGMRKIDKAVNKFGQSTNQNSDIGSLEGFKNETRQNTARQFLGNNTDGMTSKGTGCQTNNFRTINASKNTIQNTPRTHLHLMSTAEQPDAFDNQSKLSSDIRPKYNSNSNKESQSPGKIYDYESLKTQEMASQNACEPPLHLFSNTFTNVASNQSQSQPDCTPKGNNEMLIQQALSNLNSRIIAYSNDQFNHKLPIKNYQTAQMDPLKVKHYPLISQEQQQLLTTTTDAPKASQRHPSLRPLHPQSSHLSLTKQKPFSSAIATSSRLASLPKNPTTAHRRYFQSSQLRQRLKGKREDQSQGKLEGGGTAKKQEAWCFRNVAGSAGGAQAREAKRIKDKSLQLLKTMKVQQIHKVVNKAINNDLHDLMATGKMQRKQQSSTAKELTKRNIKSYRDAGSRNYDFIFKY